MASYESRDPTKSEINRKIIRDLKALGFSTENAIIKFVRENYPKIGPAMVKAIASVVLDTDNKIPDAVKGKKNNKSAKIRETAKKARQSEYRPSSGKGKVKDRNPEPDMKRIREQQRKSGEASNKTVRDTSIKRTTVNQVGPKSKPSSTPNRMPTKSPISKPNPKFLQRIKEIEKEKAQDTVKKNLNEAFRKRGKKSLIRK